MKNNNVKNIKNTKNKNINSRKPKHQKKNIKKNVTRKKNTVKTFTSKLTPNTCKLITKTFMDMLVVIIQKLIIMNCLLIAKSKICF